MDNRILPSLFLALVLFIAYAPYIHAYTLEYRIQDNGTTTPISTYPPSVWWNQPCSLNIEYRASTTDSGSYTISNNYYSPDHNLILTTVPPYPFDNNISCYRFGDAQSSTALQNMFESTIISDFTADSMNSWQTVTYTCNEDATESFIYSHTMQQDTYGNYPFAYADQTQLGCCVGAYCTMCPTNQIQDEYLDYIKEVINTGYYQTCSSQDLKNDNPRDYTNPCPSTRYMSLDHWVMTPFYTGASGIINITISDFVYAESGTCGALNCSHRIYYYDQVTNDTLLLDQYPNTLPYSNTLTLTPDRQYWLLISECCNGATGGSGTCEYIYNHTDYNISIWAYEPNWVCGAWSECNESVRHRTCFDANHKIANKSETQVCSVPIVYERQIGFEESYSSDVYICQRGWICELFANITTVQYPVNWTVLATRPDNVTALENFVNIVDDISCKDSYRPCNNGGDRSLMLRYIPPKSDEPLNTVPVSCGNKTIGAFPIVTHPYNNTTIISTNITFPSSFPELRYYVKKCPYNREQYDTCSRGGIFAGGYPCDPCKLCYATSCNDSIGGRYGITVTGWQNVSYNLYPNFTFYDNTNNDETANVTNSSILTYSGFTALVGYGAKVNSSENIFHNGTKLNMVLKCNSGTRDLCVIDGYNNVTDFIHCGTSIQTYNLIINNIINDNRNLTIMACNTTSIVEMYYFQVINEQNETLQYIDYQRVFEAGDQWEERILPLDHLNLQSDGIYTISIAVNPQNEFDSQPHCVYFDDFRVVVGETAFTQVTCESQCVDDTYYKRSWTGSTCDTEIIPLYTPCMSSLAFANIINQITEGLYEALGTGLGFKVNPDGTSWACDENGNRVIYDNKTKEYSYEANSPYCIEYLASLQNESEVITDNLLYPIFGISFGVWDFLLSQMMIGWYLVLIVTGILTYYTKWQIGIVGLCGMIIAFSIAAIFPWYFGFGVVLFGIITFAYLYSKSAGGN